MGFRVFKPEDFEVEVADSPTIEELCEEGEQRLEEVVQEIKEEDHERNLALLTILVGLVIFSITAYYFWNFINGN